MKLSSTKSGGVQSVCIPYFKINTLIYCCPRLFEEYLNPQVRINKMVNDHSVNYHPNLSGLISQIDPLKFLWIHYRFISLRIFVEFFSNLYIPLLLGKIFKFMVFRSLENAFLSQKIGSIHCYWCPPSKTFPQVLIITPSFCPTLFCNYPTICHIKIFIFIFLTTLKSFILLPY